MPRMVFTVAIDIDMALEANVSSLVTPEFLERAVYAEIAKAVPTVPDHPPCSVTVSGGGPLTEKEEYRIWLREMSGRSRDPR